MIGCRGEKRRICTGYKLQERALETEATTMMLKGWAGCTDMRGLCKCRDAFFFFCSQGQAVEMKICRREPREGEKKRKRGDVRIIWFDKTA